MEVEDLIRSLRQSITAQERKTENDKKFLAELEARVQSVSVQITATPETGGRQALAPVEGGESPPPTPTSGLRRVTRKEKADVSRELIEARPGRWTTVQLRAALTERGIDPQAGTPTKNILYSFVN